MISCHGTNRYDQNEEEYMQEFHDHLNSINPHIQFTREIEGDDGLLFLDTTTTKVNVRMQVNVYRKPTHTDKYLDFNSHHPTQNMQEIMISSEYTPWESGKYPIYKRRKTQRKGACGQSFDEQ